MNKYWSTPAWQAGIFDTFERVSSSRPSETNLFYQIAGTAPSPFVLANLNLNRFSNLYGELSAAQDLSDDWNSYGSPAPSAESIMFAHRVLDALRAAQIVPRKVLASAEGGVALVFTSTGDNRAMIEGLNDGDLSLLLYDRSGNSKTIEWNWNSESQADQLAALRKHLEGDRLAAS